MDNKILTIVVPAYNVQKYIGQCLDSLLNQTLINHKVIIVDDGSTDSLTSQICKNYAEKRPDIFTYVWQENHGLGAARNKGLSLVDTPYVGFLDSDDWITPNYVERFTEEIEKFSDEDVDIIFTLPNIYNSTNQCDEPWHDEELFREIFCCGKRLASPQTDYRFYYLEPSCCRRIYNMDFINRIHFKFPEGTKWEDIFPHFYSLYYANVCLGIEDIGFHYRINTSGSITGQTGQSRIDMVKVFDSVFRFATTQNVDDGIITAMLDMLVKYTKWSLSVSNISTRPAFVKSMSKFYRSLPKLYFRKYYRTHLNYKKTCIFIFFMLHKSCNFFLYDYIGIEIMSGINRKFRRRFLHE